MRVPDPELTRLFPPLTRWREGVEYDLRHRAITDPGLSACQRAELEHLCLVWGLASYAFKHRHVNGTCWLHARELVRQARRLMNAYYCDGHQVLYALANKGDGYMLMRSEVERVLATERRRAKAIRGAENLPRDWQARITAAIRENPGISNRKLGELIGCDEATVRRWRKRA